VTLLWRGRHVHHHYDWAKDGHKRTYTMTLAVNATATAAAARAIGPLSGARFLKVPTLLR
jgi:hypothetical protein